MATTTPNMNLVVSTVNVDSGLNWENNLNASLAIIDQHNHTTGSGVQITPAGLNINSALPFNGQGATAVAYLSLDGQAPFPTIDASIYSNGVDLFFLDGSGNQVRITQSGSVAGSSGTITGLPSGTASASFGAGTFVFQSATSTSANLDCGEIVLRNNTASSKGVTLSPVGSLGANYSLVLPTLPASTSFVTLDSSGNLSGSVALSSGIVSSMLGSNLNLPGKAVKEGGNNVVVSNSNATNSLAIVRGLIQGNGTIISGEGYTVNHSATGTYVVSYSTSFGDVPSVVCTDITGFIPAVSQSGGVGPNSFTVVWRTSGGSATDTQFAFHSIGQRA